MKSHALTIYKRETIIPLTKAVCSGEAGEGQIHRDICSNFLDTVGKFQFIYGVGTIAPICDHLCFHECDGDHTGGGSHHDTFDNCRQPECAESSCYQFLLTECDPVQHGAIETKYKEFCTIVSADPASAMYSRCPYSRSL